MYYPPSAVGQGSLANAQASTAPNGKLRSIVLLERLSELSAAVRQAGERTADIANRHLGSVPISPVGKDGPSAVPNGTLAQMNDALDDIDNAFGYLGQQIARLEQI